jgi:hypothetical protein
MIGNIGILHDSKFMILRRLHLAWFVRSFGPVGIVNEEQELQARNLIGVWRCIPGVPFVVNNCLRPPHGYTAISLPAPFSSTRVDELNSHESQGLMIFIFCSRNCLSCVDIFNKIYLTRGIVRRIVPNSAWSSQVTYFRMIQGYLSSFSREESLCQN